jgi:uncharacterized coiled-coil protein SlyX
MSSTDHVTSEQREASLGETRTLEDRLAEQDSLLQDLRRELQRTRQELETLHATVERLLAQSVATCKKCGATYDVFRHHYSIGLFDNIVYVKCPRCQTPMPVDPHLGIRPE